MSRVPVHETGGQRLNGDVGAEVVPELVPDKLLTAGEVAARLSVPESWVREETRQGRFPHVKFGRYRRYAWDDVLVYVRRLTSGG